MLSVAGLSGFVLPPGLGLISFQGLLSRWVPLGAPSHMCQLRPLFVMGQAHQRPEPGSLARMGPGVRLQPLLQERAELALQGWGRGGRAVLPLCPAAFPSLQGEREQLGSALSHQHSWSLQ